MSSLNNASWSAGLFDCRDDPDTCRLTLWCPCVTFGRITEIVDRGTSSCLLHAVGYLLCAWVPCLGGCMYRYELRKQYGIKGRLVDDCCVHIFCEACALCQEYHELKSRGFDMTIGWQENMEKMGNGAANAAPQMNPGMAR